MNLDRELNLKIRKATALDNLEAIAEIIYYTDNYIYPYWFENVENCIRELSTLLIEDKFFFNVNNLYIAIDEDINRIVGVICVVDKSVDLSYDYSMLREINERYKFTIDNYVMGLIKEVEEADFAYISNVCVHSDYRGKKIGNMLVNHVIDVYVEKCFNEIVLDVLSENPGAIHLYEKLGFEQFSEIFKGFNGTNEEKPDVFSMKINLDR